MSGRLVLTVLTVAALPVAGCGGSRRASTAPVSRYGTSTTKTTSTTPASATVDDAQIESQIKKQLSVPGAAVTSVKCPSNVKSKAGATFQCSVTWSNGAAGKVQVTEESLGHFTYKPVSGSVMVPGAAVDMQLEQQLAKEGVPNATVNCPNNIIVKVGTTVTCNVTGAQGKATSQVTFTFSDAEGTVSPSSVKTS